jgi:hypothetical protein
MRWTVKQVWTTFGLSFGLAVFIWFAFSPPIPGVAIAALAVLAVLMTLVLPKEPSKREKVLWMTGSFALMLIEILAITHDRQKQDANFRVMLTDVEDSIKTQTGGDSFAYITFEEQPSGQFEIYVTSQGKYPLQQIYATIMDDERRQRAMEEYNKHPTGNWIAAINSADTVIQIRYLRPESPDAPLGDREPLMPYPFGTKNEDNLTIAFHGFNGDWTERLHLRRFDGKWHQALSVIGPTAQRMRQPFVHFDGDFPEGQALAEKDWPRQQAPR